MKQPYDTKAAKRLRIRRMWWMARYRYTRWRWHIVFTLLDALGWCVFGPLRLLQACRRGKKPPREPRSILVVQLDHLGDAVMSLALIRCLRRRYSTARLEVLCGPGNRELLASCPIIDALHVMTVTRFSRNGGVGWVVEMLRWSWRLRRTKFDLAIDVRGEFPHAVLMVLSGARRRLGWSSAGGGFLLSDRVRHVAGRHEVLSRSALLSALGILLSDNDISPSYEPDSEALSKIDERLAEESWPVAEVARLPASGVAEVARLRPRLNSGEFSYNSGEFSYRRVPLIVLHVGAGMPAKRWPAEHWSELAARLIVQFDARIVLVGGGEDRPRAATIVKGEAGSFGALPSHVKDWTGQLPLAQLAALLKRADLFVGADSGPAHLAAAVGTPVVALFSGTNDPGQWRPWGAKVAVVRHVPACSPCHREVCPWADHPCMRRLGPDMVFSHIESFLSPRFPSYPVAVAYSMEGESHGLAGRTPKTQEPRRGTVAA